MIYVAIDQASSPLLYADLVRFRKGPKRVQRLRMLALQGLIFEAGPQTKLPPCAGRHHCGRRRVRRAGRRVGTTVAAKRGLTRRDGV